MQLKPCPFCGFEEPEIILYNGLYCVTCVECPGNVMVSSFQTKEETVEAWNRRIEDGSEKRLINAKDEAPTVDTVEVVHGHWIPYSTTMMECSVCKRHTARHRFEFCPHCGAKMDGDWNG